MLRIYRRPYSTQTMYIATYKCISLKLKYYEFVDYTQTKAIFPRLRIFGLAFLRKPYAFCTHASLVAFRILAPRPLLIRWFCVSYAFRITAQLKFIRKNKNTYYPFFLRRIKKIKAALTSGKWHIMVSYRPCTPGFLNAFLLVGKFFVACIPLQLASGN